MTISQDQLDAWKRLALDVRERMHLRYSSGPYQYVPLEMLIAVRFALPSLAEEAERLREVLRAILDDMPLIDCDRLHHAKKDRHGAGPCPVEARLEAAIDRAHAALDETTTPLTTTPEG